MLPAQNARIPFQTKKRSFDLAWGAWAGILAVMTAVGAALTGSQILLMYPKPASKLVFRYPSMPRSSSAPVDQLGKDTLAIFWGNEGVVLGRMTDVIAPQGAGGLMVKSTGALRPKDLAGDLEGWCRKNLSSPVRVVAVGESLKRTSKDTFMEMADLTRVIEELNKKIFSVEVKPAIVPVDLVNPI